MNFWTPTFHSWGEGFNPVDMPWYALYDYVEVFTYEPEHNEFHFHWRDDFDSFDSGKWHKAAGGFQSNTSVFHPANAYTSGGHLVLKMEPELTHEEELRVEHELAESFNMDMAHPMMMPHADPYHHEELGMDLLMGPYPMNSSKKTTENKLDHYTNWTDHDRDYYGHHGHYASSDSDSDDEYYHHPHHATKHYEHEV